MNLERASFVASAFSVFRFSNATHASSHGIENLGLGAQSLCNKYSPSGGVFIVFKYRLPKSAASGEKAGTGLQPWLAAGAFLRRSRACPGRQCVQRSAPARDSSSCSLSGAGVWDQRCAAGTRGSGIFWQGWRVVRGIG